MKINNLKRSNHFINLQTVWMLSERTNIEDPVSEIILCLPNFTRRIHIDLCLPVNVTDKNANQ